MHLRSITSTTPNNNDPNPDFAEVSTELKSTPLKV